MKSWDYCDRRVHGLTETESFADLEWVDLSKLLEAVICAQVHFRLSQTSQ